MSCLAKRAIVTPAPVVCIIDDDASLLRALSRLLAAAGFIVTAFASAEDFLGDAQRIPPACLVLDIHLGGLSGFELQERLVRQGESIPVVFITAHDEAAARARASRAGAVAYLCKPFDQEALIEAIDRAIGRA
jgi:FixJ family two-component response regulator